MRRLLQLGTLMLVLTAFLTPIIEAFDSWDPPGPGNDTEMAFFGLVFAFCLVLIVCKLTAVLATVITLVLLPDIAHSRNFDLREILSFVASAPPQFSPPLRI